MTNITVKIEHDNMPEDPRKSYDNLGIMVCWHRHYKLGDEPPGELDPTEWLNEYAPEGSIVLPLYLYDHSGITMSTGSFGCSWDSGQVGWIIATPDKIREWYMVEHITAETRKQAEACLRSEVEIYDHYLTGAVYGYVIEKHISCDSCGHSEPEHVDSCWGFMGDCLDAMKDHVDPEHHDALTAAWEAGPV